jgi:afadin
MDYTLEERRRQLYRQIQEWNQNRLDLFAISEPNQNLEYFGVMRFYYQDDEERVSTKCIRVASTATTVDVIYNLIEKFRPDLRMLSRSQYGLYEVHVNGEERRLGERECPLLVQLHWGRDDREGRFLLKNESHRTVRLNEFDVENTRRAPSLTRKLSTKELKKNPKQYNGKENDAERLYHALPDSNFTRSISNPEIVMQKRRQAKLERKLNEIHASEQGPDAGGTLKIYGNFICPEVPYKTLLLSVTDNAFNVVKETLEKYKLEKENPNDYCLVKVVNPSEEFYNVPAEEVVLNDFDCPLDILYDNPQLAGAGCITFHLRRRGDTRNSKDRYFADAGPMQGSIPSPDTLPCLMEINPDGTKPHDAHSFTIPLNGLEIGRERSMISDGSLHLQLTGHDILPRHCILSCRGSNVTVAPLSPDALVAVNNSRVYDRAKLENGMVLMLGRMHFFRFHDPLFEKMSSPVNNISAPVLSTFNEPDSLPAILEYREEAEGRLLSAMITEMKVSDIQFKLLPTYLVYMASRYALIGRFRSGMTDRPSSHLSALTTKVVREIYRRIEENQKYAGALAFWMANSSELLNFLTRDRGLYSHTLEAQDHLADCVQMAFAYLVNCLQEDLNQAMPAFLKVTPDIADAQDNVVEILTSIIAMLLTTNVNAALTIQLFSQMFHFINVWLFNRLVRERQLCTREWGRRLRHRLSRIEVWSEKQGLELAAECHLGRIIQSAHLLELPKRSADDITVICSSCYKLNSLQLKRLLENYVPSPDEPSISPDFIERVVGADLERACPKIGRIRCVRVC